MYLPFFYDTNQQCYLLLYKPLEIYGYASKCHVDNFFGSPLPNTFNVNSDYMKTHAAIRLTSFDNYKKINQLWKKYLKKEDIKKKL